MDIKQLVKQGKLVKVSKLAGELTRYKTVYIAKVDIPIKNNPTSYMLPAGEHIAVKNKQVILYAGTIGEISL